MGEEVENEETQKNEDRDEMDEVVRSNRSRCRQTVGLCCFMIIFGFIVGYGTRRRVQKILALEVVIDCKRLIFGSAMTVELGDR